MTELIKGMTRTACQEVLDGLNAELHPRRVEIYATLVEAVNAVRLVGSDAQFELFKPLLRTLSDDFHFTVSEKFEVQVEVSHPDAIRVRSLLIQGSPWRPSIDADQILLRFLQS